jgi:hypothetical protein
MNLHKEISLEAETCEHLAGHGWLYEGDTPKARRIRGAAVGVGV